METPETHQTLSASRPWASTAWAALLLFLTGFTFCVHGYHPLAEDGGLYVAGIEYSLDHTLFPYDSPFVRAHLRYSLFAPFMAYAVRITHLSLPCILLLGDIASIALTLFAAWQILRSVFPGEDTAQLSGVALFAAWWTLPVAGTSLMLMDPYVTARSFSMPLALLAIAFALDDWTPLAPLKSLAPFKSSAPLKSIACLLLAATMHPLMAGYAACFVFVLRYTRLTPTKWIWTKKTIVLLLLSATLAGLLQYLAPLEAPEARAADITRYYWFLSQWQSYELLGIIAPLAIFAALLRYHQGKLTRAAANLCKTCLTTGLIAIIIALAFARENLSVHLVARLQVLRIYIFIYALMALLLGGLGASWLTNITAIPPRARAWSLASLVIAIATIMYVVQRQTFPASPHVEMPWRTSSNPNPWVQAFLWTKSNTPKDALFALDAKYINTRGEDAQAFRAISLRSALPDYSKDGGEAAITPPLAPAWLQGSIVQRHISQLNDTDRDARLKPLGVTWMVLHADAPTTHPCPYSNQVVKVCIMTY